MLKPQPNEATPSRPGLRARVSALGPYGSSSAGAALARGRRSVGVARRHIAGDLGTFLEVAANDQDGRRGAGAIALLVAAIAAIEAGDHTRAPLTARGLGVDEGLHLVAPLLAFIGAADIAQIVQRAEDLGEALEAAVEGGHPGFGARRRAGGRKRDRNHGRGHYQDASQHGVEYLRRHEP